VAEILQRELAAIAKLRLVFVSPSFIPRGIAEKYCDDELAQSERLRFAARRFAHKIKLPDCPRFAINWFCSGFPRALSIAQRRLANIEPHQFILVINTNRISRITDFACSQTAALFGDMATATLLAREDSTLYPLHFRLLYATAEKQPADGAFFDFHLRACPRSPKGGGKEYAPQRLVFP
jgi:hypothetical protein